MDQNEKFVTNFPGVAKPAVPVSKLSPLPNLGKGVESTIRIIKICGLINGMGELETSEITGKFAVRTAEGDLTVENIEPYQQWLDDGGSGY